MCVGGGGERDPPAKLNFYWSIFTGVCFVESAIFTGVRLGGGGPPSPPWLHPWGPTYNMTSIAH